jgi:hypothetical protein
MQRRKPLGREPQRISVKSRTFKPGPAYLSYNVTDIFDWLAIVILPGNTETRRRLFLIPRTLADAKARRDKPLSKTENERYWRIDEVSKIFAKTILPCSPKNLGRSAGNTARPLDQRLAIGADGANV